jgi:radical SAM-linked protein
VAEPIDVESIPARLDPCLPVGLHVQAANEIEPGTPSLQQAVEACSWRIEVNGTDDPALEDAVANVLAAPSLVVTRTRKGRPVTEDVRPAVESLAVGDDGTVLADLATQPRGLRPSELVAVLGDGLTEGRVCRLHQWLLIDGARREPLPSAEARAS